MLQLRTTSCPVETVWTAGVWVNTITASTSVNKKKNTQEVKVDVSANWIKTEPAKNLTCQSSDESAEGPQHVVSVCWEWCWKLERDLSADRWESLEDEERRCWRSPLIQHWNWEELTGGGAFIKSHEMFLASFLSLLQTISIWILLLSCNDI